MDDGRNRLPAEFDRLQAPSSAYAPRQVVTYLCTREHVLSVPFAADAEVPEVWDCAAASPPQGHGGRRLLSDSDPLRPAGGRRRTGRGRGRPGGAAAAPRRLGAAGRQGGLPQDKACGDGLGPHAVDELAALGAGRVLDGYPPIPGLRLRSPEGLEVAGEPARPNHVVPRAVLDARLVEAATAAGGGLRRAACAGWSSATGDWSTASWPPGWWSPPTGPTRPSAQAAGRPLQPGPGPGHRRPRLRAGPAGLEQLIAWVAEGWPAYVWSFPTGTGVANVGYGLLLPLPRRPGRAAPAPGDLLRGRARPGQPARPPPAVLVVRPPPAGPVAARRRRRLAGQPLSGEGIYYALASGPWPPGPP